jgi:hypothetical protein
MYACDHRANDANVSPTKFTSDDVHNGATVQDQVKRRSSLRSIDCAGSSGRVNWGLPLHRRQLSEQKCEP